MSRIRGTPRGRIPASEESPARNAGPRRASANAIQGELGEVAFMHKATGLGFALALPYGHLHRYDFIVDGGRNLWRVQVKTSTCLVRGFHRLCVYNYNSRTGYNESEIDFVAVLILPEGIWYILPVRSIGAPGFVFPSERMRGHGPLRVLPRGLAPAARAGWAYVWVRSSLRSLHLK